LIELQKRALEKKRMEEQKKKMEELEANQPNDPRERILMRWMTENAYEYFKQIKSRDTRISEVIENVLIMLINRGIMQNKLTYQQLLIIERKILGTGPTIKVKRAGKEVKDLTDEFKKIL
jgi:DNA-binding TFAR19-related protein (PDSD5 family)